MKINYLFLKKTNQKIKEVQYFIFFYHLNIYSRKFWGPNPDLH